MIDTDIVCLYGGKHSRGLRRETTPGRWLGGRVQIVITARQFVLLITPTKARPRNKMELIEQPMCMGSRCPSTIVCNQSSPTPLTRCSLGGLALPCPLHGFRHGCWPGRRGKEPSCCSEQAPQTLQRGGGSRPGHGHTHTAAHTYTTQPCTVNHRGTTSNAGRWSQAWYDK